MSNTNQRYLDGTELTNLTLVASNCTNGGSGSLEAQGIIYTDTLSSYSLNAGITFTNNIIILDTTNCSNCNVTSASITTYGGALIYSDSVINGILRLCNTTNSNDLNSGSLIINGGVAINQNLNINGITTLYNTTSSINLSTGSLITLGGITINNSTDSTGYSSGGALTILGGTSISGTLYANLLNSNNSNIINLSSTNLSSTNIANTNQTLTNLINTNTTSTNIINTNLTSINIVNTNLTNVNLINTNISSNNLAIINEYVYNSNITNGNIINLINSNATINNLNTNYINASTGILNTLTVGNLYVTNSIEYNDLVINLSSSNNISLYSSIGSLQLTIGTFGNLYGDTLINVNLINTNLTSINSILTNITNTNLINTNLTNVNLINTNLNSTNITNVNLINVNLNSTNITNVNLISTNLTNVNLINTNLTSINTILTNMTSSNIISTNLIVNSSIITYETVNNSFITNLTSNYSTIGSQIITGSQTILGSQTIYNSIPSYNSTTGTLILESGGLSINCTVNSSSITSGGGLTIAGGLSVFFDTFIGGTLNSTSISSNSLQINYITSGQIYLNDSISSDIFNSNLTSLGGITILNSSDVTSLSSGGTITTLGGASINLSLLVGNTINSNTIISTDLFVTNGTINNLNNNDFNSINTNVTNLTSNNIVLNSGTFGNIIGNYITSNYITNNVLLYSLNASISNLNVNTSTITNLILNSGTFGNLYGNYLQNYNGTINTLISTNASIGSIYVNNSLYVNSYVTLGNTVINPGIGLPIPSLNSTTGILVLQNGGLSINCTVNSQSVTNGGSLTLAGGLAVSLDSYLGGNVWISDILNMNGNLIQNCTAPTLGLDVVNLWYLENKYTSGNIYGNFTQGQVIIGGNSNNIIGYNTFTFDGNLLSLSSTNPALGLGSGGSLNINGGVSILDNVFIGGGLDMNNNKITNVADPSDSLDAVNLEYLTYFFGFNSGDILNTCVTLGNNVLIPENIPNFMFPLQTNSFTAYAYLQIPSINVFSQYELRGIRGNNGSDWQMNYNSVAGIGNPNYVKFSINSSGNVMYTNTNTNTNGNTILCFRAETIAETNVNFTLGNIGNATIRPVDTGGTGNIYFTRGSLLFGNDFGSILTDQNLEYLNNILYIGGTSNSTNLTSGGVLQIAGGVNILQNMYLGGPLDLNQNVINNCTAPNLNLQVANKWYVDQQINFNTGGSTIGGPVSFTNTTNSTSITNGGAFTDYGGASIVKDVYIGGNLFSGPTSINITPSLGDIIYEMSFSGNNNETSPVDITGFSFDSSIVRYFQAIVSCTIIASSNLYSGFELKGININGNWNLIQSSIGQNTKIIFNITNSGQIQYTSSNYPGFTSLIIKFKAFTTSV